jgi:hypothetical protein
MIESEERESIKKKKKITGLPQEKLLKIMENY